MKTIIPSLVVLVSLIATPVFADLVTSEIYVNGTFYTVTTDTVTNLEVSRVEKFVGGTNPNLVTQPWGLTGVQTPGVLAGVSVTDRGGITVMCPVFYSVSNGKNCFDISKTASYEAAAIATAKLSNLSMFDGWRALAR